MTQAADKLHLTQSACNMALSAIENRLNGTLFDRREKKLILNERGKVLFPKAVNVIAQITEPQSLMAGTKEVILPGHLIIGASTTIGNYLIPKIIGEFITIHPQIKITLRVANTEQIIKKLLKFDIDIGIIESNCYSDDILPWLLVLRAQYTAS